VPVQCAASRPDSLDLAEHQERLLEVHGACLSVLDFGGSGPLLVFLPGYGNSAHVFDDLAPTFIDRYRVVALTPRGFPPSGAPECCYTIAHLAADVAGVLDALQQSRAILAGHSISGAVITAFGQTYPQRLIAAIYLDASFDFRSAVRRSQQRSGVAPADSVTAAVRAWKYRYDNWSSRVRAADESDYRQRERLDTTDAARRAALVAPLATEVRSRAHEPWRVHSPILALCAVGSYDRAFGWLTPDSTRWVAAKTVFDEAAREKRHECRSVSRSHGRPVKAVELDSGHYVFFDQRDVVTREMRAFLAEVPAVR
jgi:pimeloyl-ACP methyl ester carboxylesterase